VLYVVKGAWDTFPMTTGSPDSGRWFFGPAPDLLLGCGLAYVALFLTFVFAGPEIRAAQPSFTLPLLIMLFSMPHYGGTLLRVYEDSLDRRAYSLFAVWATLCVFALFVWAVHDGYVGALLLTVYLTWSPWHYTGQNYGIALTFLRRRGIEVTPSLKRWVYSSFILSYVLTFSVMHTALGAGYDVLSYGGTGVVFLPIGIPMAWADVLVPALGLLYLGVTLRACGLLLGRATPRALLPTLILMLTQALWFSAPWTVRYFGWHTGLEPLDQGEAIRDYAIWIFVGHGVQYLWITTYYARAAQRWRGSIDYLGRTFVAGVAIWTLPIFLFSPDVVGGSSFDGGLALVVAAAVNLHHFILDGAIWKLRHSRIANVLIMSRPEPRQVVSTDRSGWGRRAVWAVCCVAVMVALVDFWEARIAYPAAIERGDWKAAGAILDRLAWLGHDRGTHRRQVGDGFSGAGDLQAAESQYQRSLELRPSGDTLASLASVRLRLGEVDAAVDLFERALDLGADQADRVHVALGRIAQSRGSWSGAIGHYRQAVAMNPRSPSHANELAMALASCPVETERKPQEAIALAEAIVRSMGDEPEPYALDTLAASYAAAGRFEEAVRIANDALAIAADRGQASLATMIRRRRDLYLEGRAYVAQERRAGG